MKHALRVGGDNHVCAKDIPAKGPNIPASIPGTTTGQSWVVFWLKKKHGRWDRGGENNKGFG